MNKLEIEFYSSEDYKVAQYFSKNEEDILEIAKIHDKYNCEIEEDYIYKNEDSWFSVKVFFED